jgi:hypothetical protein
MDNWRPDGKVRGNQPGFWCVISFSSVSIKNRSLLVPLVMLNACLTYSWPNKVPFDREASGIIRAGIYTGVCIDAEGGMRGTKSEPKGRQRPDSWQSGGLWYCGFSLSRDIT